MPSSWLSRSDEKSSPLLQDSSDNAVQVLSTPGADDQAPATSVSLAERPAETKTAHGAPAAASVHSPSAKVMVAGGGGGTILGAEASALSSQLSSQPHVPSLPKVPSLADEHQTAAAPAKTSKPAAKLEMRTQEHQPWNTAPPKDRWKSMVHKAEEAAERLAKEHPRSVLGAHWRNAVSGNTATLKDASEAASKAGKAAQDQLVQLAKDNLKQKGIYAPAAMCEKGNFPCPGRLQAKETSTGHYAPVRDNGPSPGAQVKDAKKKPKVVMPAPARYPAVSFYAKIREEMSSREHARLAAGAEHKTSLEMLAPGERVRRPDEEEEAHREREERRDDEKRREEDALHRYQRAHDARERSRRIIGDSDEDRQRDSARGIEKHLYKLFSAPSGSDSERRSDSRIERETRPTANEEMSRDSIRSIEGSKLYQEELSGDDGAPPDGRVAIVNDSPKDARPQDANYHPQVCAPVVRCLLPDDDDDEV